MALLQKNSKITKFFFAYFSYLLIAVAFFILGTFFQSMLARLWRARVVTQQFYKIHPAMGNFVFINPLIGFDFTNNDAFRELIPIKNQVENVINDAVKKQNATVVSVYSRDLETGHWFGVNEDQEFVPASLFKVPIMIAYLKEAETQPEILNEKIYYDGNASTNYLTTETTLQKNHTYTVEELIAAMIIKSDNAAQGLLVSHADLNSLSHVLDELGIHLLKNEKYSISAKQYSLFFRTLYNATLLNNAMSEKALEFLNRVQFQEGLAASIPDKVSIAHKYGQQGVYESGNIIAVELHDCGIIYYPQHPYFLCVMTQGNDIKNLEKIISDISLLVYQSVDTLYKK